ncbi:MAG TPA: redox-sensing transcriptional repressor Rex [Trueperaceae bacterium]|nr:redox-sensing transcriptional repressor Rex [Trueperaceae bacterium]
MPRGIPSATVSRLVTYLRVLTDLEEAGQTRTSSDRLAAEAQVTAFQVRKDLAYFGSFGTRGSGYAVQGLRLELRRILGLTRPWKVAIVGMGRLGQALADFPQLGEYDFELVTAFDVDPGKVGRRLGRVEVRHSDELPQVAAELGLDIAFLTVPVPAAQAAADAIVKAGISGILNFVPTVVTTPPHVWVETVDFLAALKRLAYFLHGRAPVDGAAPVTTEPGVDVGA